MAAPPPTGIDPRSAMRALDATASLDAAPIPASFVALAEPNRFRIVELLRRGPRSVNAIAADLRLNQPQTSKHLRHLREAGMVEVHPQAQHRHYALRPEPMRDLHAWIVRYRDLWERRFEAMDDVVEELKSAERDDARGERG